MKVLLFDTTNAFLTPGGKNTHALKLQQELSKLGVSIDFSQWWNKGQEDFDIIHLLTPDVEVAKLSKKLGKKTFLSMIFDFETSKTPFQQFKQRAKNHIRNLLPGNLSSTAYWKAFQYMDCIQFMHENDRRTALKYFPNDINPSKTIIIPHAYDPTDMYYATDESLVADIAFPKQKYLVSCANISTRKQTLMLAQYAHLAEVPIVFLGNSDKNDEYYLKFEKLIDNKYVFYPGWVSVEIKDYIERNASGFVLLSQSESGCIAVYEAAAYHLPLLLSNLPWAWAYDTPTDISFCDFADTNKAISQLDSFYRKANRLSTPPFKIHTWEEVAMGYKKEYEHILNSPSKVI